MTVYKILPYFLPQTMTTPKKAKYNLRNRTVLVDASGNAQSHTPEVPRLNLDMSFGPVTASDDDIMAETAPPEWISETLNALTDEIQQLQVNWSLVFSLVLSL